MQSLPMGTIQILVKSTRFHTYFGFCYVRSCDPPCGYGWQLHATALVVKTKI